MIIIFINDIWYIIKKSFRQYYKNIIHLLLINIVWFSAFFILIFTGYYGLQVRWFLILIIPTLFLGPVFLLGLYIVDEYLNNNELNLKKIWIFISKHYKRGLAGFLSLLVLYLVFIFDFNYFFNNALGDKLSIVNFLLMIISLIVFYLLILVSMMQLYFWGLLIHQKK